MPRALWWTLLAAMAVSAWVVPSPVSARYDVWSSAPDSTVDESTDTTPEPTTPEPTTPDSSPADSSPTSSEVDESTPTASQGDALIGAGDPDSDVESTTAIIAVVGFVLVLALAGWWMVRRSDPDADPMPRPNPDSPPTDLI